VEGGEVVKVTVDASVAEEGEVVVETWRDVGIYRVFYFTEGF
jgi:hypothetical protein